MNRIGIYLGVAPESGGAFQYAASMLSALASLDKQSFELVVAVGHPAWQQLATDSSPSGGVIQVNENWIGKLIAFMLRSGVPVSIGRKLSSWLYRLERSLKSADCVLWIFPSQEHLAYSCNLASISTIHDLMHKYHPEFPEVSAFGLYARRERHYKAICSHSSAVLVDSTIGKQHVIDTYGPSPGKIHVLPYCIPSDVHNETIMDDDLLRTYGLVSQRYFFYPAQLWKHKNHLRLIDAFRDVSHSYPDLKLVLCGSDKNSANEVRNRILSDDLRNCVLVLGYIPDSAIHAFYRHALALIMPTFFGPTNIPPLEAMQAGCAMAVSDIYAMREQSGDAAIYFNPSDTTQISACMYRLIEEKGLRERLSANGLRRSAIFSRLTYAERLETIIKSILPP